MAGTGGKIDTFANRLKTAISIRETTAAEISRQTGLSKPKLSQYINGQYEAKQQALFLLAKNLDVSEAWLMGFDVPMERIIEVQSVDGGTGNDKATVVKINQPLTVEERADQILAGMVSKEGDTLMLDGYPTTQEGIDSLRNALIMGVTYAWDTAKKKKETNIENNNED